ncbi:MAG: hypothetical protein WA190_10650 [Usitatibacter sp.]
MNYDVLEAEVVEQAAEEAINAQVKELNDMRLAIQCGGLGDTVAY